MTTLHEAAIRETETGVIKSMARGLIKSLLLIVFCLTPLTALIAHGWLTRKLQQDIKCRLSKENRSRWPNLILTENENAEGWLRRRTGGLWANVKAGLKAFAAILLITLPVSLIWLGGWVAGWENSFNKGYENAGIWPLTSLLAVFLGTPVYFAAPMAIAHQAHKGTISSITDLRAITNLIRSAGFSYLWPTLLIAIGSIGVLGARALPVFAEQISPGIATGIVGAEEKFATSFKVLTTFLLFIGLMIIRSAIARNYAAALGNMNRGQQAGIFKFTLVGLLGISLWLGMIFLIYTAQFMNYNWWNWLNQPLIMLPWLG